MKTEKVIEYMNLNRLTEEIKELYKEVLDNTGDTDEERSYLADAWPEECISELAFWKAMRINDDMKTYLHLPDHRVSGNFCNIDYDYPRHVKGDTGSFWSDSELVRQMTARLDAAEESAQATSDREWLTDWFWEAFGTFGIKYYFQNDLADALYEHFQEDAV